MKRPRFRAEEVATALEFSVKYGFAKSSDALGTRFRVAGGSPAPRDVAKNAEELNECLESFSRERFHNFLLIQGTALRMLGNVLANVMAGEHGCIGLRFSCSSVL